MRPDAPAAPGRIPPAAPPAGADGSPPDPPGGPGVVRVEPEGGLSLRLDELWRYRELVYLLTWRDVKVRYKQTLLGAAWAVLQPLLLMAVFSVFFGLLVRVPSEGVPYPLFALTGLVPWTFFANSLTRASSSLVGDAELLKKVYFPRLAIPVAAVAGQLLDLAVAFGVLVAFALAYGVTPTPQLVWLPGLAALALVTAFGAGLWFSALNVQYRDVGHVLPFLVQVWLFASPVVYPASLVPERWRTLYALNPMVGVVEGFRWGLLGTDTRPGPLLAASAAAALVILITGLAYFRRVERGFADVI